MPGFKSALPIRFPTRLVHTFGANACFTRDLPRQTCGFATPIRATYYGRRHFGDEDFGAPDPNTLRRR